VSMGAGLCHQVWELKFAISLHELIEEDVLSLLQL